MSRPGRRKIWRLATVLPAVLTTLAGVTAIAVVASAPQASRAASFADGSPLGVVDHFYSRPGGLRAIGWDFDPNAKTTALVTTAAVDYHRVVATTADLPRPDVAAIHPMAGPDHGFSFFVPVPEGKHVVCIRAKNLGTGSDYRMDCTTRTFDYGPYGSVDKVATIPGHVTVRGWAIDADSRQSPVTIIVKIDGVAAPALTANLWRKDVASAHPSAGGHHGFATTLPITQGDHTVCVIAKNIGEGSNNSFGCTKITLNDSPTGALESAVKSAGELKVVGWVFDRDAPKTSLTVTVKIDGTAHSLLANVARTDIAKWHPAAGAYHGYAASYTLPEGHHKVCVIARNIGYGSNTTFACRTVVLIFTPSAAITSLTATSTGGTVRGWAADPDTTSPISVAISSNGHLVKTVKANGSGRRHDGYVFRLTMVLKSGTNKICAVGLNTLYGTHNSAPACKTITLALKPIGAFESLTRATGSANLAVTGWALDPDTTQPISVAVALDGASQGTVIANAPRTDIGTKYPAFGSKHGIAAIVRADGGEHRLCLTAVNVGGGSNTSFGCKLIIAVHPVAPSAPRNVHAMAGYGGAHVSWAAPLSDGGAPWTKYTIVARPSGKRVTVGPRTRTATITGLAASTTYTFTVRATNIAGTSAGGVSPQVKTQSNPPAQTTPAPVSTSRYIRNIRTASSTERAKMRAEGATDAYYNPSGHGYLVLLDIGGQDEFDGGVVLSATTRFVTYANLVADLKAYVDGYHSKQKASAPVTIAIGTNNDMDVSYSSGKTWASKVVNPVANYNAKRYAGITIAGANDIEPGFRATYNQTNAWLSGFLAATHRPFVFNGSADGCSWTKTNQHCNNGWTMSGLYHLAAGAEPVQMVNLPQIYNTTMAAQWKYISLTGVAAGQPRIHFVGPLTEWTACDQSNSCGSLTGHTAWSTMWSNLQSDKRLKVTSLPYSTDLRIDS